MVEAGRTRTSDQWIMSPLTKLLYPTIMIFLRPIYILTLCDLYSGYLDSIGEEPELPDDPSIAKRAIMVFGFICILTICIIFLRDITGLSDILSTPIKL